jgi:hypothetical protein
VFDIFAEHDDGLISDVQPPAKRRRRVSFVSSSVRIEQALTPLVVALSHDVELEEISEKHQEEKTLDDHE